MIAYMNEWILDSYGRKYSLGRFKLLLGYKSENNLRFPV